jgi:hypothetical protein
MSRKTAVEIPSGRNLREFLFIEVMYFEFFTAEMQRRGGLQRNANLFSAFLCASATLRLKINY